MEMNNYQAGIDDFTSSDSIVFGISVDKLEDNRKFAQELGLDFALLSDVGGTVGTAYDVMSERFQGFTDRVTFVIGKDGKIAFVGEGAEAMNPAGAQAACRSLQ